MKEITKLYVSDMVYVKSLVDILVNNGYIITGIKQVDVIKGYSWSKDYEITFERRLDNE